ncbi:DUF6932 family protein [Achromobacter xylosoxidans]|uniref:DUF6932 family protein n=1 Tax=Alcaligenes xylosoxydans xylosoxydans TaxID=85698 RepID=UPI001040F569|nr:hypothetical protein [Achromobacter xylosoxidans]
MMAAEIGQSAKVLRAKFVLKINKTCTKKMTMKPDFPSLLPPGRHLLTLAELRNLTVPPFPDGGYRDKMFLRLEAWIQAINNFGVHGTIWVDGSFLTQKPNPGDIDCVLWNPQTARPLSPAEQVSLQRLVNKPLAKSSYGLDFYLEVLANADDTFHREAYWMGILGYAHDRKTAKGFAEVSI